MQQKLLVVFLARGIVRNPVCFVSMIVKSAGLNPLYARM